LAEENLEAHISRLMTSNFRQIFFNNNLSIIKYDGHHINGKLMKSISDQKVTAALRQQQPKTSNLVWELRSLMQLTQVQLATELGVAYETINRWENGHMNPSPLALRQIRAVITNLSLSSSTKIRERSETLLQKYFSTK
jgi:putative transcriptional regulator